MKLSEILSLYVFWVFVIEYFSLSEFFVVRDLGVFGNLLQHFGKFVQHLWIIQVQGISSVYHISSHIR